MTAAAALKAEDSAPVRLAGATRAQILDALTEIGTPERELKMRGSQLWHWIYHRGARDFSAMRNIAKPVLEALAGRYTLARPEIVEEQISNDGTRKWLLRFRRRAAPAVRSRSRAVYISGGRPRHALHFEPGRCTLTCSFCHTGTQRLVRNLSAEEILAQLLLARDRLGDFPDREMYAARRHGAGGRPQGQQHRHDGNGRAALQFRERQDGAPDRDRRGRPVAFEGAASRCRLPASCRRSSAPVTKSAWPSAWRSPACRCATICDDLVDAKWYIRAPH